MFSLEKAITPSEPLFLHEMEGDTRSLDSRTFSHVELNTADWEATAMATTGILFSSMCAASDLICEKGVGLGAKH